MQFLKMSKNWGRNGTKCVIKILCILYHISFNFWMILKNLLSYWFLLFVHPNLKKISFIFFYFSYNNFLKLYCLFYYNAHIYLWIVTSICISMSTYMIKLNPKFVYLSLIETEILNKKWKRTIAVRMTSRDCDRGVVEFWCGPPYRWRPFQNFI